MTDYTISITSLTFNEIKIIIVNTNIYFALKMSKHI